jgi:hypothetical protein
MRFKELFEMPTYIPSELPTTDVKVHVTSVDTLDRDYDLLGELKLRDQKIIAAIKKDRSTAIIGPAVQRDDGKPSVEVVVTIKFHQAPEIGEATHHKAIQVDTVVSTDQARGFGYGYQLYKMLLDDDYTVVSDNIQYIGGKELWNKIIRRSAMDHHNVFILRDGKYLRDTNGKPLVYDGNNISADDIWSTNKRSELHYYTLLVAKNHM